MKRRRVISPTGIVHAVEGSLLQEHNTTCNYVNVNKWHGLDNYHYWKPTEKPVTCKNCLKILEPTEEQTSETKLKHFTVKAGKSKAEQIMSRLNEDGCTVDDIISITLYNSGPYEDYTVWYKKGAK